MTDYISEANRTNIAIYGLFFIILVNIGRVQELIPYGNKLYLGKFAFAISILLYIVAPNKSRQNLIHNRQVKYVLGLIIMALASVPMSYWPRASLAYITDDYLKTIIFFFLVITVVSTVRESELVVWAIIASVLSLSIAAISGTSQARMSASSTYDPNDLAFILVSMLPLIYAFSRNKNGFGKLVANATIVLSLISIFATVSRGGFIGLVVIMVATLHKNRQHLKRFLISFLGLVVLAWVLVPPTYWQRIATIFEPEENFNYSAPGGRINIWQNGFKLMLGHPLTGVGIDCFKDAEGRLHEADGGRWMAPHNSFVQIGAETGICGLILFVGLLISLLTSLNQCGQLAPSDAPQQWLFTGTQVALYGYIATGFFLSQAYSPVLYLLIGLVVVSQKLAISQSPPKDQAIQVA